MWRQSRLTVIVIVAFFKCLLGSSAIFMMADNKEQRVCVCVCVCKVLFSVREISC